MKSVRTSRYHNLGWFGHHPAIYDIVNNLISPLRKQAVRLIQQTVEKDHLKILDLAAGTGAQSILFAEEGHQVTGIDLDPRMVRKVKHKLTRLC